MKEEKRAPSARRLSLPRVALRASLVFFFFFTAAVYFVGNASVQLWDRDEPRYAQTSRQMLQSGDWVVPRFLDTVRTAKPVLIYWCQATAMAIFGDQPGNGGEFAARFPSGAAMLLALAVTYFFVRHVAGQARATWTVVVMASSVLILAAAKMCLTDGVLLLFVTVTQLCLYALWRGRGTWTVCVTFAIAAGLAALTKGPVALGINALTLVALGVLGSFDRVRLAHLRVRRGNTSLPTAARYEPASGENLRHALSCQPRLLERHASWSMVAKFFVSLALFAAVVAPWLILIERRAEGFLMTSINRDVIDRVRQGAEGHSAPPGYYLLTVWGTFLPWSLLLPAAAWAAWTRRDLPIVRFALAAVVGPWVMFEIVSTKLPHYLLPVFPWLSFCVADLLVRSGRGATTMLRDRVAAVCGIGFGGFVALAGLAPMALASHFGMTDTPTIVFSTLIALSAVVAGVLIAVNFVRRRPLHAAAAMAVGTLLTVGLTYALWLPRAEFLRLSSRLGDVLKSHGATHGLMIDYKEPSLAFAAGGGFVEESDGDFLIHNDASVWPQWLVMPRKRFDAQPPEIRQQWDEIASETGLMLNGGKTVRVLVLRKR